MSDAAVMAESSSYRNSINFYERMSHLQGELKNYESQQFQLEEEFQRLQNEGISFQSEELLGPTHTSTIHLVEKDFDHLTTTRSQHLASPTNLNYGQNEEMERRRRARNQSILEKLQELETNSSTFAARSERLRMMRNEYETLVRKYASYRTGRSSVERSSVGHYPYGESFLGGSQSQKSGTSVASTGVNTDITGPVRPLATSTDSLLPPERPLNIERPPKQTHPSPSQQEILLSPIQNSQRGSRDDFQKGKDYYNDGYYMEDTFPTSSAAPVLNNRIKTRPTFLDISSTSESDMQLVAPKLKEYQLDNLDDTSADTTSLSVLLPKSRGSNYMPNISTDGSLSDTTSIKQPPIRKTILKKGFIETKNDNATNTTTTSNTSREKPTSKVGVSGDTGDDDKANEKLLINSSSEVPGKSLNVEEEDECTSSSGRSSDSTSNSIGDSVMDSVQNKTPDSLPKDDSELLHITEVDEEEEDEEDNDKVVEKEHPHGYYHHKHLTTDENNEQTKSSALINEMGNQNQETWDNLSSSNLVRVAQKEIEIRNFGEGKVTQSEDIDQFKEKRDEALGGVDAPDFDSNNKARTDSMESLQMKEKKPNLMNHTSKNVLRENKPASTSMLSLQYATSSSSLSSSQAEDKNETSRELQRAVEDKRLQSVNKENLYEIGEEESSDHVKRLEEHGKSKTRCDDNLSSNPTKDYSTESGKPSTVLNSPLTNPFLVTSLQKESRKNAKTGNESKKLHLKFDYDDSESDHSTEGAPVVKAQENLTNTSWSNLKSKDKRDDLFDDFFDV